VKLEEIAQDVYACMQPDQGLGWSNSGFINRGGGLVIDTFWDLPHTRELIKTYQRVWREPVQKVVNTHSNGDHCWGNQLFEDAEIIGHRLCAQAFSKERPQILEMLRHATASPDPALASLAGKLSAWDFSGITPTPPTTLIEDRLELNFDGIAAHLIYVGPAHTSGDVIIHLPEQRIVFTGDILFRLCTPIGWDGTFDGWIRALDFIVELAPEVIVPGHGPMCGAEGAREMKDYLIYVRQEARRCFDSGLSVLAAAKKIDIGAFASWTEPERILFSIERAYREFRGEPFDTPVDATGLFRAMYELEAFWKKQGNQ
jgi:glyoxylase-like metal-dependent hydrolase (beta-lactamase superfamily II)